MSQPQIVIILHNTLSALGVSHLISDHFGLACHCAASIDEVLSLPADGIDLVVTDPQHYVEHLRYFLPRKSRVLVVADRATNDSQDIILLDSHADTEQIIDRLRQLLGNHKQENTGSLLSQRETDVLRLVASGMINKEIADRLHISINTVLTHRKNITAKLGIKSVSGLSFYAMMNGIIAPR